MRLCPDDRARSSASIALVYTGPFSVGSPYDAACLDGIVSAMLESDYDLKITHLRRDKSPKETYSQFFFRKGIRGAIIRSTSADRDVARMIGDEGFPAVVLGDRFDHPRLAFAYNESGTASAEGVEHLISLGIVGSRLRPTIRMMGTTWTGWKPTAGRCRSTDLATRSSSFVSRPIVSMVPN